MAGSVNKVILVGNLGADPEIRSLGSGDRVANLRVATSETWRDRNSGERKERTEWHRVVIFNDNLVTIAERYLSGFAGTDLKLPGIPAWADPVWHLFCVRHPRRDALRSPGASPPSRASCTRG